MPLRVIAALALVDMVVGVNGVFRAKLSSKKLNSAIGNNLLGG